MVKYSVWIQEIPCPNYKMTTHVNIGGHTCHPGIEPQPDARKRGNLYTAVRISQFTRFRYQKASSFLFFWLLLMLSLSLQRSSLCFWKARKTVKDDAPTSVPQSTKMRQVMRISVKIIGTNGTPLPAKNIELMILFSKRKTSN